MARSMKSFSTCWQSIECAILPRSFGKSFAKLMTSIKACKWLSILGCAFRGHDESPDSLHRGNFIELIKSWGDCNEEMRRLSWKMLREMLSILHRKYKRRFWTFMLTKWDTIHEEIRDAKYCILVDEALDEGNKEQMAIVLRFVDGEGFVRERFFDMWRLLTPRHWLVKVSYVLFLLVIISKSKICEAKGMMVLVICLEWITSIVP